MATVTVGQAYGGDLEAVTLHTGLLAARHVLATTPMDRIPVYVRGGAVVPMWTEAPRSTADPAPTVLELHAFLPEGEGVVRSTLQEDDGLTTAAADGAHVRTTFELVRRGGTVTLRAGVAGDGFPELRRREARQIRADHQRRLALAHEDVGRGAQTLDLADAGDELDGAAPDRVRVRGAVVGTRSERGVLVPLARTGPAAQGVEEALERNAGAVRWDDPEPSVTLVPATGHSRSRDDRSRLRDHPDAHRWRVVMARV